MFSEREREREREREKDFIVIIKYICTFHPPIYPTYSKYTDRINRCTCCPLPDAVGGLLGDTVMGKTVLGIQV